MSLHEWMLERRKVPISLNATLAVIAAEVSLFQAMVEQHLHTILPSKLKHGAFRDKIQNTFSDVIRLGKIAQKSC